MNSLGWPRSGADPSNSTCSQSMAIRKDTTSRPEITPIKIDNSRKRRSSRAGAIAAISASDDVEDSRSPGSRSMMSFWSIDTLSLRHLGRSREQQEQRIVSGWRTAELAGLQLRVIDQLHSSILSRKALQQCPAAHRCIAG